MTAREQLNARCRTLVIGMYGGSAVAIISGLVASFQRSSTADYFLVGVVIGVAIAVLSMLFIQFGVRCPFCRLRLGQLLLASGYVWAFGKNFNFCPRCGTSLDQEVAT